MNRDPQTYPSEEETNNSPVASEPAAALAEQETLALTDDMDYDSIVEGILQVTSDIEEKIAAADRGGTVQIDEFKTMFAKWLD